VVASPGCDYPDWIISIWRVIEIHFLDKFADIPLSDSKGGLSVQGETPWSHEIVGKLFQDRRGLRRREVLIFVIRVREEELVAPELRCIKLTG
jgi:hypothetical protein